MERSKPFDEWSTDAVCAWFDEMGLGFYEDELRKWLKNGAATLANASTLDIEKEINLKSPLHRKKIALALIDVTGRDTDELFVNAGKLDIVWVSEYYIKYRNILGVSINNKMSDHQYKIVGNAVAG